MCVQDMAFTLHHAQMERSYNPYQTTMRFSKVLFDLQDADFNIRSPANRAARNIPIWIRANFIFEQGFDEWNNATRSLAGDFITASNDLEDEVLGMAEADARFKVRSVLSRL